MIAKKLLILIAFCLFHLIIYSQPTMSGVFVGDNAEATALANNLVGVGITISNAHYVGSAVTGSSGTNSNRGYFYNGNATLGISTGIVLSSGDITAVPTNDYTNQSKDFNKGGDADLTAYVGNATYDALGIEFDFIPDGPYISFEYVFGSDEYNEYVGSAYNDGFAFMLTSLEADGYGYNKYNIARVPGTAIPVTINNVNKTTNATYFRDNETGGIAVEPDGMTTVLSATANVTPCKLYRLKLIIGDVSDRIYDSWVFFKENSFNSPTLSDITASYSPVGAGTNGIEGCNTVYVRFVLAAPAGVGGRKVFFSLAGTAKEVRLGAPYDYITSPDIVPTYGTIQAGKYYITVPQGQSFYDLAVIPQFDGVAEGDETVIATADILYCPPSGTKSSTLTIKDKTNIAISITNTTPIWACETGGITLTTSVSGGWTNGGPYTYAWSPASGLSATNIANPVANPSSSTVYTVTVSDACNSTATDFETVSPYHAAGNYGLWYGDINNNWDECRNWARGKIPDNTIDVLIPTGLATYPVRTGNITVGSTAGNQCKSITMQNSSSLTVTGNFTINNGTYVTCANTVNITIGGNWSEGATGFFNKGTSTVTFNGSGAQNVNSGLVRTYSFWDIVINGTDVIFYYSGASTYRVNANNIVINNTKKMSTYKQ